MSEIFTAREREIFEFILTSVQNRGYPPTVREIGKAVGLRSSSTVHGYLRRLENKGAIKRDPTKPRAIEIASEHRNSIVSVPVLGRVAAGEPLLAVENIDDVVVFSRQLAGDGDLFLLKVRGDSMVEAGIIEGDLLLVRRQTSATNGDIIVALLGKEATVKRFYKEQGHVRLQPENYAMKPIISKQVDILGRVVGLYRQY